MLLAVELSELSPCEGLIREGEGEVAGCVSGQVLEVRLVLEEVVLGTWVHPQLVQGALGTRQVLVAAVSLRE